MNSLVESLRCRNTVPAFRSLLLSLMLTRHSEKNNPNKVKIKIIS